MNVSGVSRHGQAAVWRYDCCPTAGVPLSPDKEGVRMENYIIAAAAGLLGGIETLSILMLLCRL
jgi:hypothetical protein